MDNLIIASLIIFRSGTDVERWPSACIALWRAAEMYDLAPGSQVGKQSFPVYKNRLLLLQWPITAFPLLCVPPVQVFVYLQTMQTKLLISADEAALDAAQIITHIVPEANYLK